MEYEHACMFVLAIMHAFLGRTFGTHTIKRTRTQRARTHTHTHTHTHAHTHTHTHTYTHTLMRALRRDLSRLVVLGPLYCQHTADVLGQANYQMSDSPLYAPDGADSAARLYL